MIAACSMENDDGDQTSTPKHGPISPISPFRDEGEDEGEEKVRILKDNWERARTAMSVEAALRKEMRRISEEEQKTANVMRQLQGHDNQEERVQPLRDRNQRLQEEAGKCQAENTMMERLAREATNKTATAEDRAWQDASEMTRALKAAQRKETELEESNRCDRRCSFWNFRHD